ncbi:MAG: hypothetical protein ABF608_07210 [Sporolactobacillus sp.]
MANDKIQETIDSLCEWIIHKTKNGASSEEITVLPEVAKATAELIKTVPYGFYSNDAKALADEINEAQSKQVNSGLSQFH